MACLLEAGNPLALLAIGGKPGVSGGISPCEDEYKYLGVWINRQASVRNHIRHLLGKADRLHALVRGAKFWQGEEDVAAE